MSLWENEHHIVNVRHESGRVNIVLAEPKDRDVERQTLPPKYGLVMTLDEYRALVKALVEDSAKS